MTHSFRSLVATTALFASLAPVALAGGANAKVEGPGRDGRTYTVRTYQCENPAALKVTAWAEGLVDGKRQTLPLSLKKTGKSGVFQFARNWPATGEWVIRMELGEGRHPVTVTDLDTKGAVKANQLIWEGNGQKECESLLASQVKS